MDVIETESYGTRRLYVEEEALALQVKTLTNQKTVTDQQLATFREWGFDVAIRFGKRPSWAG